MLIHNFKYRRYQDQSRRCYDLTLDQDHCVFKGKEPLWRAKEDAGSQGGSGAEAGQLQDDGEVTRRGEGDVWGVLKAKLKASLNGKDIGCKRKKKS